MDRPFNYNVGVLGHIDSGKTSLVRVLSSVLSTAALDKHPESKKRGITLDLGFSAFMLPMPARLSATHPSLQITLVDCPGHAGLIRTIIAGASIIDKMLLIIDATKGVQTQTAECLVISELLIQSSMIVVLNKIDLVNNNQLELVEKRVRLVLSRTKFASSYRLVKVSASPKEGPALNIEELLSSIVDSIEALPDRSSTGLPLYCEIDHCFPVKGIGCILTGTVLQGSVAVGDSVQIASLNLNKKVKSIQSFHQSIQDAGKGDRVGLSIGQFDSKLVERGILCTPGSVRIFSTCLVRVKKIQYFKHPVLAKSKYHITCGNETVMGNCTFFSGKIDKFDPGYLFEYETELGTGEDKQFFAVLKMDSPICEPLPGGLIIGSKFDLDCNTKQCRIGFFGYVECIEPELSPSWVKVCKGKKKTGEVERVVDEYTAIGMNMFSKQTDIGKFEGLWVKVEGSRAQIVSSFGKSGKFKLSFPDGDSKLGQVCLEFKKLLWDKGDQLVQ